MISTTELVNKLNMVGAILGPEGVQLQTARRNGDLLTAVRRHGVALRMLYRIRLGQRWLDEQSERFSADRLDPTCDELFIRIFREWACLEYRLRRDYGLEGCIYGLGAICRQGSISVCSACLVIEEI